jgi:hypothetical protein
MRKVSCDGCGMSEPLSTPAQVRKIRPVKFGIVHDDRSTVPEGTERYEADLCGECQGAVLDKFFRVHVEVPAIISEPSHRERELRAAQ